MCLLFVWWFLRYLPFVCAESRVSRILCYVRLLYGVVRSLHTTCPCKWSTIVANDKQVRDSGSCDFFLFHCYRVHLYFVPLPLQKANDSKIFALYKKVIYTRGYEKRENNSFLFRYVVVHAKYFYTIIQIRDLVRLALVGIPRFTIPTSLWNLRRSPPIISALRTIFRSQFWSLCIDFPTFRPTFPLSSRTPRTSGCFSIKFNSNRLILLTRVLC